MVELQLAAARTVHAVLQGHSLAHLLPALWTRHPAWGAAERGTVQDLCYGTLRDLCQLRAVLAPLLRRPLPDADLECLVLVALYQLRSTRAAAHAVVNQAVDAAVRLGKGSARPLVNALLRNYQRRFAALENGAEASEEARLGHPRWWIDRARADLGPAADAALAAANVHPPMALRVNARRLDAAAYAALLREAGMGARTAGSHALVLERPVPVERLPGFADGLVSVQDLAAQAAAFLLGAGDGERVLDACAAPGGKAAHLCELARVELTALDADAERLARVRANLARLGLEDAGQRLAAADATRLDAWWDGRPFPRVLVDAPCSGSGVSARHPDIRWLRRPDDLPRLAATQAGLLDALWRVVASGGTLLYATCSVFAVENREQISGFLARRPDARLLAWQAPARLPDLRAVTADAGTQLLPNALHDGFFYALLQKH